MRRRQQLRIIIQSLPQSKCLANGARSTRMYKERKTAVLTLMSAGITDDELRALDVQRPYQFALTIEDVASEQGVFYSPIGDERWHELARAMRELPLTGNKRHSYGEVYNAGVRLFEAITVKSRALRSF